MCVWGQSFGPLGPRGLSSWEVGTVNSRRNLNLIGHFFIAVPAKAVTSLYNPKAKSFCLQTTSGSIYVVFTTLWFVF